MKMYKQINLEDYLITPMWRYSYNYNQSEDFGPWRGNNHFYLSAIFYLYFPGQLPHGNYVIKNCPIKIGSNKI